MLPHRDSRLTRIVLIGFFLVVVFYAYYEGRGLLFGPTIEVSPRVMEVSEQFITIQGRAERIVSLSLNGTPISITENGDFEEGYVLAPGYNRIVLEARDRYGKKAERILEIVYRPSTEPSDIPSASSTPELAPQ